jgi:class 3 adenylate cyclase
VDLSNYSKITGALADRGAHAISNIVNGYLGQLLEIIQKFGGDCVKFAGDAILVVWEGPENELEIHAITAAACSMDLQRNAGDYQVEGTEHRFRIHCGLACGRIESEIFQAPVHQHMQRLYHSGK